MYAYSTDIESQLHVPRYFCDKLEVDYKIIKRGAKIATRRVGEKSERLDIYENLFPQNYITHAFN